MNILGYEPVFPEGKIAQKAFPDNLSQTIRQKGKQGIKPRKFYKKTKLRESSFSPFNALRKGYILLLDFNDDSLRVKKDVAIDPTSKIMKWERRKVTQREELGARRNPKPNPR